MELWKKIRLLRKKINFFHTWDYSNKLNFVILYGRSKQISRVKALKFFFENSHMCHI